MLSPSNRVVLLPQDREIMDITGMSEEEYRWFVRECYKNNKLRPGEPVAIEPFTLSLILTGVGILLSAAAMLLAPKPEEEEQPKREEETIEGQDVVRRDRFAPKSGFDSFQNVVDIGSVVPVVYCKREELDGTVYGGLRVNTNLLWSQILSVGGGQFFRGIFLVGEAGIELDHSQLALGNNTLAGYELKKNAQAGRVTLYYTDKGGRIVSSDYELGVVAEKDIGNQNNNDVYEINKTTDFCQALQPSNQVEFGVYGHIGNNFGFKEGEPFVPCSQWQNRPDAFLERQDNQQRIAEARKGASTFHTRAGFVDSSSELQSVNEGDELTYKIYRDTDYDLEFRKDGAGAGDQKEAVVNCHDIATSVSSEQRTFDELINIGDLYKAGSAIVVCTDRTDPFISDVDYDGRGVEVTAKFEVIREGKVHVWKESDLNTPPALYDEERTATICSEHSQLFRLLVGAFSIERAFKTVEVGLHSNVRLQSSGVMNFNSLVTEDYFEGQEGVPTLDGSYQAYLDAVYCSGLGDGESTDGDTYRKDIRPGTYSSSDSRYSFFRIRYRDIDDDQFTDSNNLYGVRSSTGVDTYCYMRFLFTQSRRREFQLLPVSSWEIRSGEAAGKLYALDAHMETEIKVAESGFELEFVGEEVERSAETFTLKAFTPPPADVFEICKDRGVIKRVAVQTQGNGYTDINGQTVTFENVRMRGQFKPDKEFDANVRVTKVNSSVGYVEQVYLPSGRLPGDKGFEDGDPFVCVDDDDIGGGTGFIGTVTIGTVEECEDVDGTLQLGISPVDDNDSYVDSYARVAEAFTYAGVTTTASEPEHKISYVNIISENEERAEYNDLSIVGLNIRSSKELRSLDQLSVYCTKGVIDSHLFPDVLYDLLTNRRYGTGEFFNAAQIDKASFDSAAAWTQSNRYFYDGAVSQKTNLRTWAAQRARDFLLDLSVNSGKFTLSPAIDFDNLKPVAMYSSGNIIDETLQVNYFDVQERLDVIVSVRWREERRDTSIDSKGLFPQIREFTVRRSGVSDDAPVIQVDMSNFCTNRKHAEDRAKLECQSKRYITHAVTFKTTPTQTGIKAGDIIKLGIETVVYEQPQNGVITANGEVTSWPPLADGTYRVLLWDGTSLSSRDMTVKSGKAQGIRSSVFCVETATQKADTYKVSSISFDEDGNVDVQALYWGQTSNGKSLMTVDWNNSAEWEING